MVLSAIQSPRRPTWTNRRDRRAKFFFFPGVDWCITTVNSSLTRKRVPKALLPFFCPTKPPINELTNQCMTSMQDSASAPRQIKFDTDSQKFLIDSGASAHIWNRRKDFIYYRSLSPQERKNDQVLGVSGEAVSPQGIGSIRLRIEDDLNDIHTIHLHDVRYLPEAPINIFVPQVFSQQRQAEGDSKASCSISADSISLQWTGENGTQVNKYVPLNKSNVGICFTASGYKQFRAFAALCGMPATFISDDEDDAPTHPPAEGPITMTPSDGPADKPPRSESEGVTTDFTVNPTVIPSDDQDGPLLKSDQAALMLLHEQLGHCSFAQLKQMAEQGIIPRKFAKVPPPKCPSCLYGKAHRKPWRTHKIDPKIKPTTVPGAVVSIDQLESPVPGFVPIAKGQPTVRRYRGASVFVDHATDFTYVHMHQHLTTDETLDAKHAFERLAEQHGVHILHYHCDNGRFANKAFVDDVRAAHQTITFCGVGAHHQNGIAEWRIRDITENARTSLLHAAHRWPKAIAANLWPQAIKHVVNVCNALPRPGKTESPLSKFAGTSVQPNLKHFHPFGCPVYVLQAPLQTRNPFPKWGERSRIGIFLCHSPHHASSVPLILSTQTGLVSPQFHCVFDDNFDTVKREQADPSLWKSKAHLQDSKDQVIEKSTRSSLISTPANQSAPSLPSYGRDIPQALQDLSNLLLDIPTTAHEPEKILIPPAEETTPIPPVTAPEAQDPALAPEAHTQLNGPSPSEAPVNIAPSGHTRTGRQVRRPARFAYAAYHCRHLAQTGIQSVCDFHPFAGLRAFASTITQPDGYPDAMPLNVAMQQPDREKFIAAMARELGQHTELKHWKVIHKSQVPKNAKPIPMVWTLRRKRDPAGEILKWKARLCAGGHRQVFGDTYWTTFAPVVSWTTVRCVFIMALLMGWHMRSIDFVMAYTQADVKTDIFMQLPSGTTIKGVDPTKHLLKLQKNLYGLKDGQVTWHEHIKAGLLSRGFRQSKVDPCLFIKGTVLLVLYVDDAALFSPDSAAINREIESLKKSFELTDEGELHDYLGTRLTKQADGRIELQQKKTIDNCLDMLGMGPSPKNVKTHDTPAESSKILHADEDGDTRKHAWNYRAVVGCLNYLQAMTRPDLAYSVHQCARFCNNPKLLHEQGLKRICRYLYLTRDQGLIFKPNLKDGFKCYVDADWAGNWLKTRPNDKTGALSRTGYIITYANCPIVWGSKMQSLVRHVNRPARSYPPPEPSFGTSWM